MKPATHYADRLKWSPLGIGGGIAAVIAGLILNYTTDLRTEALTGIGVVLIFLNSAIALWSWRKLVAARKGQGSEPEGPGEA